MKRFLIILAFSVAVFSCVYPYEEALQTPENPVLTVDGNIVIGGYSNLSVGYLMGFDGNYPQGKKAPVLESWWVEDEDGTKYFPKTPDGLADTRLLDPSHRYRIVAVADGITCMSEFAKTLAPPTVTDIEFQEFPSTVHVNVSLSPSEDNTGYIALDYEEIWEFHALLVQEYDIQEVGDGYYKYVSPPLQAPNYWCWKQNKLLNPITLDISYTEGDVKNYGIISFMKTNDRNHRAYYVKVRARTLTEEEYRFLSNLELEGDAANNLFSPNPGEVPGNVYCADGSADRVLGYVSVFQGSSLTANLDSRYLKPTGRPDDSFFAKANPESMALLYYEYDFRPVMDLFDDNGPYIGWANRRCVECTLDGGSLEKPEFTY